MNRYTRTGVVVVATALLSGPLTATAEVGHADDERHEGLPWYANVTGLQVSHNANRIAARLHMPSVRERKLAEVRLKVQRKGTNGTWVVSVGRNRHGKITHKNVAFYQAGNDGYGVGVECKGIRTGLGVEEVVISIPRRCVFRDLGPAKVRGKAQVVARDDSGGRFHDSTPFTRYLARG